jgi:hypothetical protein
MKKINYFVLMAVMMLIGTNVCFGTTHEVASAAEFTTAWGDAKSGDIIKLTADVTVTNTMWLGTETLSGTPRSIEIDLAGNELSSSATYAFMLTHGSLKISNSGAFGEGKLIGSSKCTNVFYITGSTNKDVDPSVDGANYFTHLEIAEGVIVQHDKYDGAISIDGIWKGGTAHKAQSSYIPSKPALNYITNVYANGETVQNKGVAHGVRVDLKGTINGKKYGIKSNGYLGNPTYYFDTPDRRQAGDVVAFSSDLLPAGYKILATDIQYSPYIYIYPTGRITVLDAAEAGQSKNPVGIYAAGYARWKVEGYAEGCNGAVIKSGQVDFTDATVIGTGPEYEEATASNSGTTSSGSGIVVASTDAYAGGIEVSIGGDTEISSQNGYALEEVITTKDEDSKVEVVEITGGSFEGSADQGSIKITDTTVENGSVEVSGGQIIGGDPDDEGVVSIGGMSLTDFLDEAAGEQGQTHVTITTNEDGDPVMVIVSGGSPKVSEVLAGHDGDSINWKHSSTLITTDMSEDITENLTLEQLQITQKEYDQTVTVKEGVTLEVGSVVLGERAKIIVEPGATFKVTKKDGIYAPRASNLILQTQAGKPSIFLFNPAVTTNAHPHATVQFKSVWSFRENSTNKQWERFGLPTWKTVSAISCDNATLETDIQIFTTTGWDDLGILKGSSFANTAKLNKPFVSCELLANTKSATPAGATYSFEGELTGNDNAELNVFTEWTPFANSYSANVDMAAFLAGLAGGENVDATVYKGTPAGNGKYSWKAVDEEWMKPGEKLAPMEAFILRNTKGTAAPENSSINYKNMVYDPAVGSGSGAPRRAVESNNTAKLRIVVEDAQGEWDDVKMTESTTNTHNAVQYPSDNVNMYAQLNEENLAIVAREDLENTYFGFSTVEGGVFTISFTNVEGREFEFVDLEANKAVKVAEGNTYTFTAAPNTVADYRFKLVGIKNMPTAVDNLNAAKNQTGIYTIMGQYIGEMNLWNSLPAGVYVVNGEKRVK